MPLNDTSLKRHFGVCVECLTLNRVTDWLEYCPDPNDRHDRWERPASPPISPVDMPQHACIAIGIDRYRYMQPLRYALEDAHEFHAAIAQLDASETTSETSETSLNLGTLNGWSQTGAENGNGNGNGSTNGNSPIAPSIATLTPFTISVPDDDPPHHDHHLLLTETSPQVSDRSTYPTREAILHALYRWTSDTVTPDQTLWCFFSGYGLEVDGVDYLLPIEGNPNRLDETAIPIETVFDALAAAPTDRVVLILDINRPTSADRDSDIGLQTYTLAKTRNIPTILSCQPHQRSYETRDLRHGLFSAVLLEALRHRKCPTLESLERYLTERVPELCNLHLQPTQTPLLAIGDRVASPFILFDTTPPCPANLASLGTNANAATVQPTQAHSHNHNHDSPFAPETTQNDDVTATIAALPSGDQISSEQEFQSDSGFNSTLDTPSKSETASNIDQERGQTPTSEINTPNPLDFETSAPAIMTPHESIERSVRSPIALASSILVWLGLFGAVLGLGLWLNDRVTDTPIEAEIPQASETIATPTDQPQSNSNQNPTQNPTQVSAQNPTQNPTQNQPSTLKPTPTQPNQSIAQPLAPSFEPGTIATLHSVQASPLSAAIIKARTLKANDPGYASRMQTIERWGLTIFEIAQSRADHGQWTLAIAAARLVPPELGAVKTRAYHSIKQWTHAQVNEQILTAARKMITPNQVSSYWRAIDRLRAITEGQPFYDQARTQIDAWSWEMLKIAQTRAAIGQRTAAIQAARLIPRNTAAYADARQKLEQW